MNWGELIAALCAVISTLVALYAFFRDAKWRDSEEAKRLIDRVDKAENRLTGLEQATKNLATKEDVARVEADVRGLERTITNVDAGVTRIETFLMTGGRP